MAELEVCVDNIESAENAVAGGASRLELCAALSEGGLTPTVQFLKAVKSLVKIPVFVMIRPRKGDFCYSKMEKAIMEGEISDLKNAGADGFVFGALNEKRDLDIDFCKKLICLCKPLPTTLHRVFDVAAEPHKALEDAIEVGFSRILTSGQGKTAELGSQMIANLISKSRGRIIIMPGCGINTKNVQLILSVTKAIEFHASASVIKESHQMWSTDATMGSGSDALRVCDTQTVKELVSLAKCVVQSEKD